MRRRRMLSGDAPVIVSQMAVDMAAKNDLAPAPEQAAAVPVPDAPEPVPQTGLETYRRARENAYGTGLFAKVVEPVEVAGAREAWVAWLFETFGFPVELVLAVNELARLTVIVDMAWSNVWQHRAFTRKGAGTRALQVYQMASDKWQKAAKEMGMSSQGWAELKAKLAAPADALAKVRYGDGSAP